jgi:hypothetical protein
MKSLFIGLGLVASVASEGGTGSRGGTTWNQGEFKNGQAASAAYTAGGTSKPCTGLYCQDNPLGNPCPCPTFKPCKHLNRPDGHCMYRVNVAGQNVPDSDCGNIVFGNWTASLAGQVNTGKLAAGTCMCTAGSGDVYESVAWGNCDRKEPKWCDSDYNGNACPPRDCEFYWSAWTGCSRTCGGGRQSRSPLVVLEAKQGGKVCPAPQERKCNVTPCKPRRTPTPAPTRAPTPAPTPAAPGACPDKKTKNRMEEAENLGAQVKNMKEGLKASEGAACARDLCSEQQNHGEETQNLLEERMNEHVLTCDGLENCREMSMSSTHSYAA